MLLMGMHLQVCEVMLNDSSAVAERPLPISAMVVFIGLLLVSGLLKIVGKFKLLTRQELLCVFFTMLISAPMMTQGMWHRFLGLIAAPAKYARFDYIDAYSDKLWPHGPNLLDGSMEGGKTRQVKADTDGTVGESFSEKIVYRGSEPVWEEIEYNLERKAVLPRLENNSPDEISSIILTVPVAHSGRHAARPGQRYMVSCLVRPKDMGPKSNYFIRIAADEEESYDEVVSGREPSKETFIHRTGFVRVGHYNTLIPSRAENYVRVEIGLKGTGALEICDPRLLNVSALEGTYAGRRIISRSEYEKLPIEQRADLVVKPDNMWSPAGLLFLVTAYIPIADWIQPAIAWSAPIILLLLGMLAVNVVMRKQWAERERYPFPLFQIPRAMLGPEDEPDQPFSSIWCNRYLWAGFAFTAVWGLLKGWSFYNPDIPELNVRILLQDYFSDPNWGSMWQVTFSVSALAFSICMFFELNVLVSLVIGFFIYRSLFWTGEWTGWKVYAGYPFRYEQAVGAYLGYALVVLFLMRKYLMSTVVYAFKSGKPNGEMISYRSALILLVMVFVGFAVWANWMGISVVAVLAFFAFLLSLGFVTSKFRAECGIPGGYFTPYNAMLFVSLIGGITVFGADGMMFCLIASGFLTVSVFFLIPGAQMELLEYGRRYKVVPRHLLYTALLGILGGLFIGGWVFLTNAYSVGGETIRYQWAFNQDWFFTTFRGQLAQANSILREGQVQSAGVPAATYAYIYGAVGAAIVTVLRQLFSGFWFHPIGFILGSSHMAEGVWGSALAACAVRYVVLKFGGAATVRKKLMPFCVGMFLAVVVVSLIFTLIAIYLRAHGVDRIYGTLT